MAAPRVVAQKSPLAEVGAAPVRASLRPDETATLKPEQSADAHIEPAHERNSDSAEKEMRASGDEDQGTSRNSALSDSLRDTLQDSASRSRALEEIDPVEALIAGDSAYVMGNAQQEDSKSNLSIDPDMEVSRALTRHTDKAGQELAAHDFLLKHEALWDIEQNPLSDPNSLLNKALLATPDDNPFAKDETMSDSQKQAQESQEALRDKVDGRTDAAKQANDLLKQLLFSADGEEKDGKGKESDKSDSPSATPPPQQSME